MAEAFDILKHLAARETLSSPYRVQKFVGAPAPMGLLAYTKEKPKIDRSRMCVTKVISTQTEDRSRDVVVTAGIDCKNHMLNPVVLLEHAQEGFYRLAVGKAKNPDGEYTVKKHDGFATGQTWYSQSSLEGEQTFAMVDEGILPGASIGFRPRKARPLPWDGDSMQPPGLLLEEVELLEYSDCVLPDNPECTHVIAEVLGKNLLCGKPISEVIFKSMAAHLPRPAVWSPGWDGKGFEENKHPRDKGKFSEKQGAGGESDKPAGNQDKKDPDSAPEMPAARELQGSRVATAALGEEGICTRLEMLSALSEAGFSEDESERVLGGMIGDELEVWQDGAGDWHYIAPLDMDGAKHDVGVWMDQEGGASEADIRGVLKEAGVPEARMDECIEKLMEDGVITLDEETPWNESGGVSFNAPKPESDQDDDPETKSLKMRAVARWRERKSRQRTKTMSESTKTAGASAVPAVKPVVVKSIADISDVALRVKLGLPALDATVVNKTVAPAVTKSTDPGGREAGNKETPEGYAEMSDKDDERGGEEGHVKKPGAEAMEAHHDHLTECRQKSMECAARQEHEGVARHLEKHDGKLDEMARETADKHHEFYPHEERLREEDREDEAGDEEGAGGKPAETKSLKDRPDYQRYLKRIESRNQRKIIRLAKRMRRDHMNCCLKAADFLDHARGHDGPWEDIHRSASAYHADQLKSMCKSAEAMNPTLADSTESDIAAGGMKAIQEENVRLKAVVERYQKEVPELIKQVKSLRGRLRLVPQNGD